MFRSVLAMTLLLCLAGCAVVDLAAHGVKQYEKSKVGNQAPADTAASAPAPATTVEANVQPEPEPVSVAPSSSGAIKAQSLD